MKDVITGLQKDASRLKRAAEYYTKMGSELVLKGQEAITEGERLAGMYREVRSSVEVLERFVEDAEK